ncbi:Protein MAIN-LIKE 1 [Glycine soja]
MFDYIRFPKIMVRTRGIGRALGRTIRKVLGRRDESDDDAHQRRRPTASAFVVEDPLTTAEELINDQPEEPIEEGVTDVEGFPGGPHDTSVLTDFENHIALRVWNGDERPELKLSSHGRKMTKFGRLAPKIEGFVVASGLSPLITCSLDTGDRGLMFAFVECWHKETSSFHMFVGEVTITLDDVASLLHFPVVRAFHSFELLHVDNVVEMLVELLEVSAIEARAETIQCHGSYVRLSWLRDVSELKIEACDWIVVARAYLLHLLGCTLFVNKNAIHVHVVFLDALRHLTQSGGYVWGATALVHMYDNLNDASKSTARQLAGYITLLQCWIYEHFPSVGSAVPAEDYDERRPCACRWTSGKALSVSTYQRRLDRLTLDVLCWILYGDHHSFREFETIPPHPTASSLSVAEIDDRWMQFGDYITPVGQLCAVSGHCSLDYIDWFYMISHSFMSSKQAGDHPKVPSVQQYEEFQPMAAAAPNEEDIDVHHLRHAVDDFVTIADKLDMLLNMRIFTEGI